MTRRDIFNFFLLGVLLFNLGCLWRLIQPYAASFLIAWVLAAAFYPMHERFVRVAPRHPWIGALLSTLTVLVVVIGPFGILGTMVVKESEAFGPAVKQWGETISDLRTGNVTEVPGMKDVRSWARDSFGISYGDFRQNVASFTQSFLGRIRNMGGDIAMNSLRFITQLFAMLFTLFFFFRDGPDYYTWLKKQIPLTSRQKHLLGKRIHDIFVGAIRGWFFAAVLQGLVATLGYFIVGAKPALLLGFLTMIMGLLPLIGTALVWVPVVVFLYAEGHIWQGTVLLIWGTVLVGLIDNVLRPYLVGQRLELPFFFLFWALVGGIQVFGGLGIIIGPLIVAILPLLLQIFRQRFLVVRRPETPTPS